MAQRIRMFKTLACLATAMTGTAALLGWMNQSQAFRTEGMSQEQLLQQAQSAVRDDVPIRRGVWTDVTVVTEPMALSSGTLLAATGESGDWHFRIDPDGRSWRGASWSDQQFVPGYAHTVRIHVPQVAGDEMLPDQLFALRALLGMLNEVAARRGTTLPVLIHPFDAKPQNVETQNVKTLARGQFDMSRKTWSSPG